jgi:lipopolysaccharide export system permease protein
MAKVSNILTQYLIKEFMTKFFLFFCILMGVVYLFDTIELIKRASGNDGVGLIIILQLALYKLPDVGQQVLPFIVLFAGIATFRTLSQRQELVCIRSAGISAWQFITPLVVATFVVSLVYITILNPLSAAAMGRYEALQNLYFGNGSETITVIDEGLWIRQEDHTGNFILKASELDAQTWTMNDVTVFFFDENNTHIQRIDAKTARLNDQEWVFNNVAVHRTGQQPSTLPELMLTTTLTAEIITESFSNPQTISFWRLPHFIGVMQSTGLDTTDMRLYYQSLLSQPLLLIAMIFMAAAIALRTERMATLMPIIVGGLGFGFLAFFLSGFLRALGMGHEIPITLAIWSTPIIIIMGGMTILSRLEDG